MSSASQELASDEPGLPTSLLGHRSAQPGEAPQVRVIELLPVDAVPGYDALVRKSGSAHIAPAFQSNPEESWMLRRPEMME